MYLRDKVKTGARKYNPSLILSHEIAVTLKTSVDEPFIFDDDKDANSTA
jgi:DNA-binding XRE family transcriptional regulator